MSGVCTHLQEALQELEELKQIVPKESLVYFLIGKVRMKTTSWSPNLILNIFRFPSECTLLETAKAGRVLMSAVISLWACTDWK